MNSESQVINQPGFPYKGEVEFITHLHGFDVGITERGVVYAFYASRPGTSGLWCRVDPFGGVLFGFRMLPSEVPDEVIAFLKTYSNMIS